MPLETINVPNYLADMASLPREKTALSILDGYARSLAQQTGLYVHGFVNAAPLLGKTRYTFYLLVPQVNDYNDPLFYIWSKESDSEYPVNVLPAGAKQEDAVLCKGEQELIDCLNRIFREPWVRQRISHWIELARERTPKESR